jgi:hypothetical protein
LVEVHLCNRHQSQASHQCKKRTMPLAWSNTPLMTTDLKGEASNKSCHRQQVQDQKQTVQGIHESFLLRSG